MTPKSQTLNNFVSVFEKSFLFKRRRSLEDLKVLPHVEYVNTCAALAQAAQCAQGLSKAQRSKQWCAGVPFWTGITESALNGLVLRATDGVAWIYVLGYYDKLQRSVVQAYPNHTDFGKHGSRWH